MIGAVLTIGILLYFKPGTMGQYGILVTAIVFIVLRMFSSLNVIVTPLEVRASFGPGWIKRRIPVSSIISAKAVQNSWLMGWGVRVIPHGMMFNVSGLDAVELELRSGGVFRIGTDEPERLELAIREAMQAKGNY
jgi:hypothetical protein